uniref:Carbohydrate kinase PfkB domain-containing protein n=1 Tax=Psilocybe cubensis TaxID=181762 RepID=A0A8H8CQV5_PSICU
MSILRSLQGTRVRSLHRGFSTLSDLHSGNRTLLKGTPVDIHPEVEEALAHNKPVVALETALVTHGFPYPSSLKLPLDLEQIVRSTGSIPATIGIIGGRVKIGMTREELDRLASRVNKPAKISRRDIAAAIALKADGGTTCSGTLVFTALAGIKVFATGGLGGVHRGGEKSLDISADLPELTRCPVGLVSSGVKSILDIPRTLEYLETLGVPVITYNQSKEFPAFFSRHSGQNVPWNMDNPSVVAEMLFAQHQLGMQNGALIAVPIPEEYEEIGKEIQEYVNQAVLESERNGISQSGKDATPWLLSRIAELSAGKSLPSNIALLENTALVGGQIAVKYQELVNRAAYTSGNKSSSIFHPQSTPSASSFSDHSNGENAHHPPANVVVIGSAAVDITSQEHPNTNSALAVHSTAPGRVNLTLGGVGRNIAEASHRIMEARFPSLSTVLISSVGRDAFGHLLVDKFNEFGIRTDGLIRLDHASAVCNMVLDSKGTLVGGVADMTIVKTMTSDVILPLLKKHTPTIVAVDGNLSPETITSIVEYCEIHAIKENSSEPTSVIKSTAILPAIKSSQQVNIPAKPVAFCTPNLLELDHIYDAAQSDLLEVDNSSWWSTITSFNLGSAYRNDLEQLARMPASDKPDSNATLAFLIDEGIAQKAIHLLPYFQHLVIKCGDQGVLVAMCIDAKDAATSGWARLRSNPKQRYVIAHGNSDEIILLQHFPSLPIAALENVTGAGDSFVGALLATLASDTNALYHPKSLKDAIYVAQKAAVLTLQSHSAVSPALSTIDN